MTLLKIKNTYDIKISGKPNLSLKSVEINDEFAVLPSSISFIKPKLNVRKGDLVKQGDPIFFDKQDPRIVFVSPAAGEVKEIQYGPKRIIERVIIKVTDSEDVMEHPPLSIDQICNSSREDIVNAITVGGLWGVIQQFPFRRIPSPDIVPPQIIVRLGNDEPHHPCPSVYLAEKEAFFEAGLSAIKKICDNVIISKPISKKIPQAIDSHVTHHVKGHYPANQIGTILYHTKTDVSQNVAWGIDGQDLVRIGQLLIKGTYPSDRVVVVAGPLSTNPCHVMVKEGASIKSLLDATSQVLNSSPRLIAGGVFQGRKTSRECFLGFSDSALHIIQEGKSPELLSFFRLGFDKPTYSRTYFSAVKTDVEWEMNTSLNGGGRSCISCGKCVSVCPVDIYPQLLMKSIYANDIEESMKLGLLDCMNCGLCTYVCPSKINLDTLIAGMQSNLEKETRL
jgi:Na+-transporting NADH:ubiquinone oxidoreductase subunit A